MVDKAELTGYGGTSLTAMLAAIQTNEVFQVIEIILACVSFVVSIAYTIYKWHDKATRKDSDGGEKITPNEIKDLAKDIKNMNDEEDDNDVNRN